MAVDEEVGIVAVDAMRVRRSLRISRDLGGTLVNQDAKVVRLPIRRDGDQDLSPATCEALEKLPEYLYRG